MIKNLFSSFVVHWLRLLAQLQLMKVKPIVVGVTGSSGKSSCVEAIRVVLSVKKGVKVGSKGNSETGIPMEILGIPVGTYNGIDWLWICTLAFLKLITNWERYQILVLEMGIDSDQPPKNMSHLLTIVKPQIGVLLSISAVHGQNFSGTDTLQSIANEKGKLLMSLNSNGMAIYSTDYPQILKLIPKIVAEQSTFSSETKNSDIALVSHSATFSGTTFVFAYLGKQYTLEFPQQLHFKESFGTFASAVLVGLELGIDIETSCQKLSQDFKLPPGRMSIIEGINQTTLIDSSYNSSLAPTSASLRMLNSLSGRKVAILGDMRELGPQAQHDHEALAEVASKSADIIVLIGPLTKEFVQPKLLQLNFPINNLYHFQNAWEAVDSLKKFIQPNDVILIKGSQNTIFLEIIVKELMLHPEKATKLLCRQTEYWEKQRQHLKTL